MEEKNNFNNSPDNITGTGTAAGRGTWDRYFKVSERGSSIQTEVRAGVTTFLTMAYILFVNPLILGQAGMPGNDVAIATAFASGIATLLMGLYANYPFALAPGMGLNAFFTYGVVKGMGVSWQVALTAVFVEGLLFLVLAQAGLRRRLVDAIPYTVKIATTVGIGLFLAIIGMENAKFVVHQEATLVTLGSLKAPSVLLCLLGIGIIGALMVRRVKGAMLIGILVITVISWVLGYAPPPKQIFAMPSLPHQTLFAFDFGHAFSSGAVSSFLVVVLAFLFVDIFDTAGTLMGIGRLAGFLDKEGRLPGADRAFTADAVGTTVAGALGSSAIVCYIESATGVEEGGRTGLTAVVIAIFFFLALFLTPLFTAVPAMATAPALIIVGALMMSGAKELDWNNMENAIPAFLTIVTMPFTYSIAHGISIGIVSWTAMRVLTGRWRDIHPIMAILTLLLVAYYATLGQ